MFCGLILSLSSISLEFLISPLNINNITFHSPLHFTCTSPSPTRSPHQFHGKDVAVATFCEKAFELFYYYILKKIIAEGIIFKVEKNINKIYI